MNQFMVIKTMLYHAKKLGLFHTGSNFFYLLVTMVFQLTILNVNSGHAHAVLDRQSIAAGQAMHVSIAIGHGCDGAATTRLSITIPDGLLVLKIDSNDRFKVQSQNAKFERALTGPKGLVEEGIKEIIWSEGQLADKVRGEFGFDIYASNDLKAGQVLAIPAVQLCEQGERRWVEQADTAEARGKLTAPAPVLTVVKAEQAHLDIRNGRSRVTPNGAPVAGGYVSIRNWSEKADRLIAASISIADRVEIHEMTMADGVMRMRALDNGLEIPAGAMVELKAGSYHLMFIKPTRALIEGEWIEGSLTFERAGIVPVRFKVEAMGGNQQGHTHGAHGQ